MKNIILIAVQGAGKGTIAEKLKEKYGYAHISTGDILRERAQKDDDLGREIKNLIDNGIFAPDELIFKAIEEKISSSECQNGYILDGFPRNIAQAKGYDEILKRINKDIGIVINLTIPTEMLKERIIGRRVCKGCGKIYNIYSKEFKPKKDGICDICGKELYQRKDDNEESMNTRIKTYFEVTQPIIDYYKQKGVLKVVDSSVGAEYTFKEIEKILEEIDVDN